MRTKRSYHELGSTQQWERCKQGRTALAEIGVPASALCNPKLPPTALLPLSTADRRKVRSIDGLYIPGEKVMAKCKITLASTHGTRTAALCLTRPSPTKKEQVTQGAYVCDPLLLLRTVATESPFVSVGGDKGGGFTKLGVTYKQHGTQHFLPLLVFEGDDDYEDMHVLRTPHVTIFSGQSDKHADIFSVLQYIINQYNAFLNGDWPFISCMLAHKGAAASFPCPICLVPKEKLYTCAAYRRPQDGGSLHDWNAAFLTIPSNRIVPTPLHLYLGISNRIIFDAFKEIIGEQQLAAIVSTIRTKHSVGCGGLSDLHVFNGPEIHRWIHRGRGQEVAAVASAVHNAGPAVLDKIDKMSKWMKQLEHYLLRRGEWNQSDLFVFRSLLDNIHACWNKTTKIRAFPKLHMLRHAVEFAERYHILGAASEAQIESFHVKFNALYHVQHRNMSHQPFERVRRCLADSVVALAAPMPADDSATAATALLQLQVPVRTTRQSHHYSCAA